MTIIYTIDTNSFEPISFGSNYLYNQYDKIQSFLIKNYSNKYKDILANPTLNNGQVLWSGNFDGPMSRLSDLSEDTQQNIKTQYWSAKLEIEKDIQLLLQSRDKEKQNWGGLLKEVFNEDNNVILSNGSLWCLLWGWKFRNQRENYLSPEFMPRIQTQPETNPVSSEPSAPIVNDAVSVLPQNPEPIPVLSVDEERSVADNKIKPSLWDRIKRFLRRMVYKLWGLMLLIVLILFIACMCKKCSRNVADENCRKMDSLNNKLIEVEKKAKDRCEGRP